MSDDRIMSRFNALTDTPTSRRRSVDKPTVDEAEEAIDYGKPRIMIVKGIGDVEFFEIRTLAMALNRSTITIRSWEDKGVLPLSRYRTQAPHRQTGRGTEPMGRRLYTRYQIDIVVDAARRTGVMDNHSKAD